MIPVNTPIFNGNEEKYLVNCIRSGWISSEGSYIKDFEDKFSQYVDRKFGVAVSNGSAALDIAIKALNIGIGDEVIVPTFTIISPVQSIVTAGATPILVDSLYDTWNMNVFEIENKITNKTKAILVVHIYGLPVDMAPVIDLCKKYKLFLIEDAAEMHGQTYNNLKCGSFGDISIFSFYPNKHITTGEGGMLVCDDLQLSERCKKLRNLAFEPNGRRFVHNELGWNYRMTNLQAAIGLAQLENIENHIQKKREIGEMYNDLLSKLHGFQLPLQKTTYANNIYWVFGLVAESEELYNRALKQLESDGIGTRPFFWCMHKQPIFQKMRIFDNSTYPIAEKLATNGFYLPSGLGLTKAEIKSVIESINKI